MRLQHLPLRLEEGGLLLELGPDVVEGPLDRRLVGHVLRRREERQVVEPPVHLAGERIEVGDLLDLVPEERDPVGRLERRGLHLDHVAADAEPAAGEERVVALVLDVDELPQHLVAVDLLARRTGARSSADTLGRAETVDARHRGDDQHVPAHQQRGVAACRSRSMSSLIDASFSM